MIQKWSDLQLKFDLDLDELADEGAISPEQARLISESARRQFEEGSLPNWFEDYQKLIEMGWPWRVATYIAWASSVRAERKPATLKELATDVLGLTSPRVVYTWRQKYPSIDAVVSMMQAAPLWQHRADVLKALVDSAMDSDYKHFNDRKLFLEMTGDYTPKSEIKMGLSASGDDIDALSDEQLRALAGEIEANAEPGDDLDE